MFLSIVIPVWNDEKYLNECLDSCLDQKLPATDYEIICVDDGSTDNTPQILREYAERNPNVKVITKQHGSKYGSGRAIGMDAVNGEYVWFVDHDDFVAPGAVDDLRVIASGSPEYDRIQFPCYRFAEALTVEEKKRLLNGTLEQNFSFPPVEYYYIWSSIIKMDFLRRNDIRPNSARLIEAGKFWGIEDFRVWGGDWVFVDECYDKGVKTLSLTGKALYHYRVNRTSETNIDTAEAAEFRKRLRLNMALYRGHRAWIQKLKYLNERKINGKASAETADRLMEKLKDAVFFLSLQSSDQWNEGIKRFKAKDILLDKKPEEYSGSFRTYWKRLSKKEKLLPHVWAFYYCYTKRGVDAYTILSKLFRIITKPKRAK